MTYHEAINHCVDAQVSLDKKEYLNALNALYKAQEFFLNRGWYKEHQKITAQIVEVLTRMKNAKKYIGQISNPEQFYPFTNFPCIEPF